MRALNYFRISRGFSILSVMISIGLLSILTLAVAALTSYYSEHTAKVETKIKSIGVAAELRANLELAVVCSQFIKKDTFSYPGLQPSGAIILSAPDPGFPLIFSLDSGILTGDATQTSTVKVNSLQMYDAELIENYYDTRVYSGRLMLSASSNKTSTSGALFAPFFIGRIHLTVDKITNKITGCSDRITAYSLCAALGGKYDPTATPVCNFSIYCAAGEALVYDVSGKQKCTKIIDVIGKICPASTFFKTTEIATAVPDILCKGVSPPVERVVAYTTASCINVRNSSCATSFNYRTILPGKYAAAPIKKLKLIYYAFTEKSSTTCRIRYTPTFDFAKLPPPGGYCGRSCQLTKAVVDPISETISISAQTNGFAKNCKGNACEPCVSNVRVEYEF